MAEAPAGGGVRGRDWSDLPPELLELISGKINEIDDFVRFGAVCKAWRSASISTNLKPQVPWAVLPFDPESSIRRFYSVSANTVHTLHLPESRGHALAGTSHGWLIMADISLSLSLFNPLTRTLIPLPPFTTFPNNDIIRFSRTADGMFYSFPPSTVPLIPISLASVLRIFKTYMFKHGGEFIVVVSFSRPPRIAYCRRGDASWTTINSGVGSNEVAVTHHEGRLYVLDHRMNVRVCDLSLGADGVFVLIPSLQFPGLLYSTVCYLFGTSPDGELLLITRHGSRFEGPIQLCFYKSDLSADQPTWSEARGIGGDLTLFFSNSAIGYGDFIALLDSDASRCKKSSIYGCGDPCSLRSHGIQIQHVPDNEDEDVSEYIGREMMTFLEDDQFHYPMLNSTLPTWMTPMLESLKLASCNIARTDLYRLRTHKEGSNIVLTHHAHHTLNMDKLRYLNVSVLKYIYYQCQEVVLVTVVRFAISDPSCPNFNFPLGCSDIW